jgi:hypothetical protein
MNDFTVKLEEARRRLPLKRLMEQYGRSPANGNWKSFQCPYCGERGCAGVFPGAYGELFKCHHSGCVTGTQHDKSAWDEIGFLAHELKLSREEAALVWLKQAGVPQAGNPKSEVRNPKAPAATLEPGTPIAAPSNAAAEFDNALPTAESASRRDAGAAEAPAPAPSASAEPTEKCDHVMSPESANDSLSRPIPGSVGAAAVPPAPILFDGSANVSPVGFPARPPATGETSTLSEARSPKSEVRTEAERGPLAALRFFFSKLAVTDEDLKRLWEKRGLTGQVCRALGFRSSLRSNKAILEEMRELFPMSALLDACLWVREDELSPPRPNPQFYGWGVAGKNPDSGEMEWDWTNPVLIPYVDAQGELLDLRPHKRTQRGQSPRVYAPRPLREYRGEFPALPSKPLAVITEGEFKAAAIFQTLGSEALVAALPGITMAKPLFGDVEDLLSDAGVRQAAVVYDNEEKADPKLPGFADKPWRRFDSEVWARYLCRQLAREGFDARVGHLPKEWRDARGKADWDGALALMIARSGIAGVCKDVWPQVQAKARAEFLAVIKAAVRLDEVWETGLFDREAERHIRGQLEKISYVRRLPEGGDEEVVIARRLHRLAARIRNDEDRLPAKARSFLLLLAKAYLETKGGYYIFKALRDEEKWNEHLARAAGREDVEVKRACEIAKKGVPERITDFLMEAEFVLRKVNGDRERLVTVRSMHGPVSDLFPLTASAFAQPSKFRECLLNRCDGATWRAGERELNDLQADVTRDVIWKTVRETPVRGYDDVSKCWFYGDVVYTPEGKELFADKHGVVWVAGKGYRASEFDQEAQYFCQGTPMMRPGVKCADAQTRELFQLVSQRLFESIGNYGGHLALGAVLAYAAAPELFEYFTMFPGLWLHGETNQGKTSVARWLMRIWGFVVQSGMPLPDSTKAGLSIGAQQYGNLPIWLEEFQPNCPPWLLEKMKEFFNRESGIKKTFDEVKRKVRAGAIVTGVATSSDPQLRSRYCHVQVSEKNRLANHYRWFEDESKDRFCFLGRYLMRHRPEFARLTIQQMKSWMESQALSHCDDRARLVHGAAYSAFAAMVGLLESHPAEDLVAFKQYLVGHVERAAVEVRERVNVNQFWTDLLAALHVHAFGETVNDRLRMFRVVNSPVPRAGLTSYQTQYGIENPRYAWTSQRLYFLPDAVINGLRAYKRRLGQELPLDKSDLRAQMRSRPYWVEPKDKRQGHKSRFGGQSLQNCWCIDLDLHELGFQPISDEEFDASRIKPDGCAVEIDEWVDPRRGDLFALVDALAKPQPEINPSNA